jgi:hypothetical protein
MKKVRSPESRKSPFYTGVDTVEVIHQLAPAHTYAEIAEHLNAAGWRSAFGRPFTAQHVGYVCRRDGLGKGQRRRNVDDIGGAADQVQKRHAGRSVTQGQMGRALG